MSRDVRILHATTHHRSKSAFNRNDAVRVLARKSEFKNLPAIGRKPRFEYNEDRRYWAAF